MTLLQTAPLLIIIITGLLLGLLVWGLVLNRSHTRDNLDLLDAPGNLRLWLLLLGVFSLGVFIAYTLENFFLNR